MENVLTFVALTAFLFSALALFVTAMSSSLYITGEALKDIPRPRTLSYNGGWDVVARYEGNGLVSVENRDYEPLFYVRLLCWDRYDVDRLAPVESNGEVVVPAVNGGEAVEFNLLPFFSLGEISDRNVACVAVGKRFAGAFIVR